MFAPENADDAVAFAQEFLDRYTAVGFGALSKREVDLLLIQFVNGGVKTCHWGGAKVGHCVPRVGA